VHRLVSTDGFVVFDLDDADAVGVLRCAPKVLVDGATWLARSMTYRFAAFEQRRGGASAGINARDGRDEAIAAAVAELAPLVGTGALLLDPAKGVPASALASWGPADPRPADVVADPALWTALSVAVAADTWTGGLEGRRVAIEGFDSGGGALAAALAERGATVTVVAAADGSAERSDGFAPDELAAAWQAHGTGLAAALVGEPTPAGAAVAAEVDLLLVGSKAGVLDHTNAGRVRASVVVPWGPVPVTAKALAILRRAGTAVLPDFVATAGPSLASWPSVETDDAERRRRAVTDAVRSVVDEVRGADDGPLLAACRRAEAFLSTWQDALPFGRPLA
jgi:glutamate dehydrogenase/leucine dehydrogenase